MQQLSFKNRIAFNYIITTALLIFVVFSVIFFIVKFTVYSHINKDISIEVTHHLKEIAIVNGGIKLLHQEEWNEREHRTVDVNPVFIQFLDKKGQLIEKSPNLKSETLFFNKKIANSELFDTKLLGSKIRQIQVPVVDSKGTAGYVVIAMSLEGASLVIQNLFDILIIAYPLILIVLFLIARFIAGRSIKPISAIIATSNVITKDHLSSRIPLPQNRDELYVVSQTINNLLDRIEKAIEREKQFTSDASHELRTPLTVIKGTLEVLIRKARNPEEYETKINYCIGEVDRLNYLVDQLLLLARYENQKQSLKIESVNLKVVFVEVISRNLSTIQTKNILIETSSLPEYEARTDQYLFGIIINNLISNALKYSNPDSEVKIFFTKEANKINCTLIDYGIGIAPEDMESIYSPFFRSHSEANAGIKGIGLGLSIVKKLCSLLHIEIHIASQEKVGTTVVLSFIEDELK